MKISLLQLLQLCETESISYLDEVASSPKSMNVAKDFVSEVWIHPSLSWFLINFGMIIFLIAWLYL